MIQFLFQVQLQDDLVLITLSVYVFMTHSLKKELV